jgi:hypothetical protein
MASRNRACLAITLVLAAGCGGPGAITEIPATRAMAAPLASMVEYVTPRKLGRVAHRAAYSNSLAAVAQ